MTQIACFFIADNSCCNKTRIMHLAHITDLIKGSLCLLSDSLRAKILSDRLSLRLGKIVIKPIISD